MRYEEKPSSTSHGKAWVQHNVALRASDRAQYYGSKQKHLDAIREHEKALVLNNDESKNPDNKDEWKKEHEEYALKNRQMIEFHRRLSSQ